MKIERIARLGQIHRTKIVLVPREESTRRENVHILPVVAVDDFSASGKIFLSIAYFLKFGFRANKFTSFAIV